MNWERVREKLDILANAAKYDVSCSSSGSKRSNKNKGLGNSNGMGICHSYAEDGRCISLLKILLSNVCIYDCLYCVSRKSNDIKRAAFTVDEVVQLTIQFYRRNYIEGLFLSSGIFKNADFTMERMVRIVKKLREEEHFNGYIHLKAIPGASEELLEQAGLYADRLSANIELPTKKGLELLAPDKSHKQMVKPMQIISNKLDEQKENGSLPNTNKRFARAGQSSQMIIGASDETDLDIVKTATALYQRYQMKRVYYSGYVPVTDDERLPKIGTPVPIVREHRLYQTDWLYRFYHFHPAEIVNNEFPNLDLDVDPKLAWALRNRDQFPVDVNKASYRMLLRIPGIGIKSAKKICAARKYAPVTKSTLKKMGIAMNRAQYFMICKQDYHTKDLPSTRLKELILKNSTSKFAPNFSPQLSLFE